jgi:hypothetical protein
MGEMNFAKKSVDAKIILTAQVLKKVFRLRDLPSSFGIMMPIDGPFSKIALHKSKALGEIGRVVIAEKANLPILPTPTIMPPPARKPVPWGNL